MRLEEGINLYVRRKQDTGMLFSKGYRTYRSFLGTVGNLSLNQISAHHVLQFLDSPQTSAAAFRIKHSLLRHFFEYWAAQGAIAELPIPPNRPVQRSNFLPYIFTREELRKMLRLGPIVKTSNDKIHYKTVRAVVLTLYATGATVSEVTRLVNKDVDIWNGSIKFIGNRLKASRSVPLAKDLVRTLRQYVTWQKRVGRQSKFFFSRIDGRGITPNALGVYFRRLRRAARVAGYRDSSQRPCLRDLRATFAVHQITAWIRKKQDLGHMLPALGAYLGHVYLHSTERYLQLTPERFQSALNKLSPQNSFMRWRGDPALLEFLVNL